MYESFLLCFGTFSESQVFGGPHSYKAKLAFLLLICLMSIVTSAKRTSKSRGKISSSEFYFYTFSFWFYKFWLYDIQFSSVQFFHSVVSDSLRPHESQHTRPPCPSPTPGVHPNPWQSSRWCHPAISSSVVPFSSCPQSLPASGSFSMNQLFAWGGQSTGVSASASFLPKNTQDWSPLGWTGWISCSPRDSQESSLTPQFKSINSSALSFLHPICYWRSVEK